MANHNGAIVDMDMRSHENNRAHRTEEMDRERLIVRRGQSFFLSLQGAETMPAKHHLALVLYLGRKDQVVFTVEPERGDGTVWWFDQQRAQGEVLLTLHSPADAPIGQYRLAVMLKSEEGIIRETLGEQNFILLFNPWCKDDAVYLSDESQLQEYIMNESGVIYTGNWNYIGGRPWDFGQFEDNVVDICLEILDHSNPARQNAEMDIKNRSDPAYVGRIVSAMVNSNGDQGVLFGKWLEPYTGGVRPTKWTGSVPILQQWSKSGRRGVKYGQCWVFAAVACTVLRCLGIPTRCITNFSSAHDVDTSLTIDKYLNEDLEEVEGDGREDSSWNFHCWVESWMKREDLPAGYDGWQVLDPTPQEQSEGVYCCGPCPVKAIKEGELGMKYDAPFVYAEVNADIITWIVRRDGRKEQATVDTTTVGRNISTKSVYGDYREDVTDHYKYPEGSKKEREVNERAGRRLNGTPTAPAKPELQLSIKRAQAIFGTDFDVVVEVKNEGSQDSTAQLTLMSTAVTYNSVHRGECQRKTFSFKVPAHEAHKEVLRLRYEHYAACVSEHNVMRVVAMLDAPGLNQPVLAETNIPLVMPELQVQVRGRVVQHEDAMAYISFKNPLPVTLKGGVFTVEGAGLLLHREIPVNEDIAPGQEVKVNLAFRPSRRGMRKLVVDFDSDKLKDVKGVATLVVNRKKYSMTYYNY